MLCAPSGPVHVEQIGPYRILEKIGEGGMGVVYMAEQDEPVRRQVALKMIKPGMDTAQVVARFEAERQALAMMDHPNIAKVLDAGDDRRRPPVLRDGVRRRESRSPPTATSTSSTPRERLELFVQVCEAVQHAHQKGDHPPRPQAVERPGRRCTTAGPCQVIDFGVAKAIEPAADRPDAVHRARRSRSARRST